MKKMYIILGIIAIVVGSGFYIFNSDRIKTADPGKTFGRDYNRVVTYEGIASNINDGAVLVITGEIGASILVEGLKSWPDYVLDKEVSVTGKLVWKYNTGDSDNQSKRLAFEQATWKLK